MRVLGVIPARYASTRFPGKVLAPLGGRPLILHVVDRAREARSVERLIVATDDRRVAAAVEGAGVEVRMTEPDLPSGSDRAAAVMLALAEAGEIYDTVVNFQGDEPFLPGEAVDRAVARMRATADCDVATLAVPATAGERNDPNAVKVVTGRDGRALYFSRASIPFVREDAFGARTLKHVGLYVFRREYLERFVSLEPGALERAEKLEQLRALEDGARIQVEVGAWPVLGVDTPGDLARAEARLAGAR